MNNQEQALGAQILSAFQRAYQENEMEIAEHLLRALEVLARRDADGESLGETAYLILGQRGRSTPHH